MRIAITSGAPARSFLFLHEIKAKGCRHDICRSVNTSPYSGSAAPDGVSHDHLAPMIQPIKAMIARIRRYAAADDERAAAANTISLVLAWNTPLYPLYLLTVTDKNTWEGLWLTLFSFPILLSIPIIMQKNNVFGRAILLITSTGNTIFCTWILGETSGTMMFLFPCITLTTLLFRKSEPWALWPLLAFPIMAGAAMYGQYPPSPFACQASACSAILRINVASIVMLLAFIGLLASGPAKET